MTLETPLPAPVERALEAVNQGDTEAFLALFKPEGLVNDWGSRYAGHAAIKTWSDREFIGAKCRLHVTEATTRGAETSLMADVASEGFNGPSRFVFVVEGEQLGEMRITAD